MKFPKSIQAAATRLKGLSREQKANVAAVASSLAMHIERLLPDVQFESCSIESGDSKKAEPIADHFYIRTPVGTNGETLALSFKSERTLSDSERVILKLSELIFPKLFETFLNSPEC